MPVLFDRVRLRALRDLSPLVLVIALVQGAQACRPNAAAVAVAARSGGEASAAPGGETGIARTAGAGTADGSMDDHGRRYLELVAALALRDPASVDARIGRPSAPMTIGLIIAGARDLRRELETAHRQLAAASLGAAGGRDTPRVAALLENVVALETRAAQLSGARLTFAEEVRLLTGAPAPEAEAAAPTSSVVVDALDRALPGRGLLATRISALDARFVVPPDRLPAVIARALTLCREATLIHLSLPADERLEVHYAPGAPWSGFSRYQGGHLSVLTINTDLPLPVDRVLDLACHEGYPGHHVINTLRDEALVGRRGWFESAGVLTFSPVSYALESLAAAAPRLVFTDEERLRLVRDELVPLAGLPPEGASLHVEASRLLSGLDRVTAGITWAYLAGASDRTQTLALLRRRVAMEHPEATIAFIDQYRAYATAYTAGRTRATELIGPPAPVDEQWRRFVTMALAGRLSPDASLEPGASPAVRSTTN